MDILLRSVNVVTSCTGRLELWLVRLVDFKSNLNPWLYVILRKENLRRIVRKFRSCRAGNIQDGEGDGENDRLVSDTHMWNKSFRNWAIQSPVPQINHQINLGKQNKISSLLDNLSSFRSRHTTKSTNNFFFSTKHRPAMHELLQQYYLESLGKPKIGCKEKHQKSLYLYEINQFLTAKINARGQFSSISN